MYLITKDKIIHLNTIEHILLSFSYIYIRYPHCEYTLKFNTSCSAKTAFADIKNAILSNSADLYFREQFDIEIKRF